MTHRTAPFRHALLPALLVLAACSGPSSYAVPPAQVAGAHVPIRYGTVAVREVSLPSYAASQEIYSRGADGALTSSSGVLWADDPTRAMTQDVARALAGITGAQVAAEPWPFYESAQAAVEIRVSDMLAETDGTFRLSGQYFVAPEAGGRGRSGQFALSAPVAQPGNPAAIAAARSQTVRDLALMIARNGLR
jgi:uncharacterized lipoprotein YmbA